MTAPFLVIIAVIMILIVYFIYLFTKKEGYHIPQKRDESHFRSMPKTTIEARYNGITGAADDPIYMSIMRDQSVAITPMDHYIIGSLAEHIESDAERAANEYAIAALLLQDLEEYDQNQAFILDNIRHIVPDQFVAGAQERQTEVLLGQTARTREGNQQYFEMAKAHTPDPQNVHDHQLNRMIVDIYKDIKRANTHHIQTPDIRETLIVARPDKAREIALVLDKIDQNNRIENLDANEGEVLYNVWQRVYAPENAKNRQELINSVADAVAGCYEVRDTGASARGDVVCAQGRTARVISSLAHLDADRSIATPVVSTDIIRNEALTKAANIVKNILAKSSKADVDKYVAGNNPDLEEKMSNEVRTTLERDYAHITGKILEPIIVDALAGI